MPKTLTSKDLVVTMKPAKEFTWTAEIPDNFEITGQLIIRINAKESLTGKEDITFSFLTGETTYQST